MHFTSGMESAKSIIDKVAEQGSCFVKTRSERGLSLACAGAFCTPCAVWSLFGRLITCTSCRNETRCGRSWVFESSDAALNRVYEGIYQEHRLDCIMEMLGQDDKQELIKYAADKIRTASNDAAKYAVTDVITPVVRSRHHIFDVTPNIVMQMADKVVVTYQQV